MVLRRGPFGMFMSCPDYSADPPCKTIRKLSQKQQQKQTALQPTGEACPHAASRWCCGRARMASLFRARDIRSAST